MPELQPNGGFEWTQAGRARMLRCAPLAAVADHVFTSRDLQLRGDRSEWGVVADALSVSSDRLLTIKQVHGAGAAIARLGDGAWTPPEADVIASDDPTAAITVRVADCAPVLLADTRLGVVAAAHAGWRGTVQRAARAAVTALQEAFGSRPSDLIAAIGPCLGACCGEVGPEVLDAFRAAGHADVDLRRWFTRGSGDRWILDLGRANADQLVAAGVPRGRVHDAGICTKTHSRLFHSYRADGAGAGRMAAAIRARQKEEAGKTGTLNFFL